MWLGTTGPDAQMLGRRKQHKLPRFLLQHGRPLAHEPVGVRVFSAADSAVCPPIRRRGAVSTWGAAPSPQTAAHGMPAISRWGRDDRYRGSRSIAVPKVGGGG